MLLTKDQILAAEDLKTVDVDVPEWGGTVRVSMMSGAARDAYEDSIIDFDAKGKVTRNLKNARAKLCAASIIDESGNLMFSEKEIDALGRKSAEALNRVFTAAQKLNALSDEQVEDLAKNS